MEANEEEPAEGQEREAQSKKYSKELLYLDPEEQKDKPFLVTKKPLITKLPYSSVLSQAKAFLPSLKTANEELQKKIAAEGAEKFNIEHVAPEDKCSIQMNIALAPLELKSTNDASSEEEDEEEDEDDEEEEEEQNETASVQLLQAFYGDSEGNSEEDE